MAKALLALAAALSLSGCSSPPPAPSDPVPTAAAPSPTISYQQAIKELKAEKERYLLPPERYIEAAETNQALQKQYLKRPQATPESLRQSLEALHQSSSPIPTAIATPPLDWKHLDVTQTDAVRDLLQAILNGRRDQITVQRLEAENAWLRQQLTGKAN